MSLLQNLFTSKNMSTLSSFNPLLLNDRIIFCGEKTFEISITISSSITPTAGY